ncbi:HNH endonuclease [Nocardia beijingensis]
MVDDMQSDLPVSDGGQRAWLVISKAVYSRLGGGLKYDDHPSRHYHWDNYVPNFRQIRVGDAIVVWDNEELVGASVIEAIESWEGTKARGRCPGCNDTGFKRRAKAKPTFRCDCGAIFENPVIEEVPATHYRSSHEQGWIDLDGLLGGAELRALCAQPKSQLSIREIDWAGFRAAVAAKPGGSHLAALDATSTQIQGGHTQQTVRVRLGQTKFRKALLAKYDTRCAFSGDLHPTVLEACHLYSYAKVGRHHEHGGVLLRRDLHTLFDNGDLAVDAEDRIDVRPLFREISLYGDLHGKPLTIAVEPAQREWFRMHWALHRALD